MKMLVKMLKAFHYLPDPPLFLFLFATLMQYPILHQYVYSRYSEELGLVYNYQDDSSTCGGEVFNKTEKEAQKEVQKLSARFNVIQSFVLTIPTFIACLYYGALSDKIGRKPIFLVSVVGGILDSVLTLLVVIFNLPVPVLYAASFINGCGGGYTGLVMSVMSYLADVTLKDKLPFRLAVVNAILLFGMMASSYVSGPFIGQTGFAPPQIFTLVVKIVTFLWIVVLLRESLGYLTNANNTSKINQENKVAVLKTLHKQPLLMWRTLVKPRQKRGQLYVAVLVNVFDFCFTVGVFSVVQLYFMNSPFCWPPHQIGLYDGTSLLLSGLGTAIGVKLGMLFLSESALSFLSTILGSSYYFMLVFVETRQLAYAALALKAWNNLPAPIFRAIVSRLVDDDEKGAVFSLISSFQMLLVFVASFVFNATYSLFNSRGHVNLFWFIPAGSMFIPLMLICIYWCMQRSNMESLEKTKSYEELDKFQRQESSATLYNDITEPTSTA